MLRTSSITLITLLLLLGFAPIFPDSSAHASTRWGADYFPNVTLTTHEGKSVRFYDDLLKGKIVVIDLIYTHCKDECPLETAKLAQVQRLLGDRVGKDIFFYSVSIDPKNDTPQVLKAYSEKFHVGPGWTFLTGKQEDIELIAKKLGLYSPNWGRDGHAPSLMLGNEATGQWVRGNALDNPRFTATMIHNYLDGWGNNPSTAGGKSYSEAPNVTISKGQYLFRTRCSSCHTIGHGDSVGPDLHGITERRNHRWLSQFIAAPDKMLASGDPIAKSLFTKFNQVQMPNVRLSTEDVDTLIDYIKTETVVSGHHHHGPGTTDTSRR